MNISVRFLYKQKTAYELRISDWSSDVCSSDLKPAVERQRAIGEAPFAGDLVHIERHRADLPARAAKVARHALRRRLSAQAIGGEARHAIALAHPDIGARERPAHRRQVDVRRAAGQAERRIAAGAAQGDARNTDIAPQAVGSGAEQRGARTAAQVERAAAEPESADHDSVGRDPAAPPVERERSGEHTSEVQSLMRISYAVF